MVTKGPGSKAAGIAMAFKLIDAAQDCLEQRRPRDRDLLTEVR